MTGNERETQKIPAILIQSAILSIHENFPRLGNPMTISQLRRRVDALKRRFAPELAIINLRRVAEAVANECDSSRSQPPEPGDVIGRIADAGFRLSTFANLRRYLEDTRRRGDVPDPCEMTVSLLPWARQDRYRELLRWDLPAPAR